MLKYLLFCQCAILLAFFERVICPSVVYSLSNFGISDRYCKVFVEGDAKTGRFIFKKTEVTRDSDQHFVIPFSDISRKTVEREENKLDVVSFFTKTVPGANFNIKFKHEMDARHYVDRNVIPQSWNVHWGRVFMNWRPAKIVFDVLHNGDVAFKVLDKDDKQVARIHQTSFHFKRSEMSNAIWSPQPDRLYLRNRPRMEDYFIHFSNQGNVKTFKDLFPKATYDGPETSDYYFIR